MRLSLKDGLSTACVLMFAGGAVAQPGQVVVWGTTTPEILAVPAGTYWAADGASSYCIGLRADRTLVGWGSPSQPIQINVPLGTFGSVSCGEGFSAAIRTDRTIAAWGIDQFGETVPPTGTFTKIDAGKYHAVGLRTDGTIAQWGNDYGPPPVGQFLDIAAGDNFSVGLRVDGTLAAWGFQDGSGQLSAPAGQFVAVAAGKDFGGALRSDGSAVIWGTSFGNMALFTGDVRHISASMFSLFGLRSDGTLTSNVLPIGSEYPPPGTYNSIGIGSTFGLAVVPAPLTSLPVLAAGFAVLCRRRR